MDIRHLDKAIQGTCIKLSWLHQVMGAKTDDDFSQVMVTPPFPVGITYIEGVPAASGEENIWIQETGS